MFDKYPKSCIISLPMTVFIFSDTQPMRITLDRKLGAGGEGTVYAVAGDTARCVKIYHEKKRTPELEAKLTAMIAAPPKDPTLAAGHYSICWPQAIVYEDEACTTFIGFIMPLIDTNVFREYHLLCDKPGATSSVCYRLENFGTGFTYLHMYVVALNLASCVASIHEAGHAIGDLNDKNILVSTKDSKITIVDCDSFEIHGTDGKIFPCSVYMPEYSAPEVIKHETIENRQYSDRFALVVLIFKLLMLNTHPYASRGSSVEHLNTPGEKIADGYYPYEDYDNLEVFPPAYALPYDIIPPNIKELFRRCFKEGQHNPVLRPSANDWFAVIKENYLSMHEYLKNKRNFCLKNTLHMYPTHLSECPWCAMKDDYFPKTVKTSRSECKIVENFAYIEKLIKDFAADGRFSKNEKSIILKFAERKNISEHAVNEYFNKVYKGVPTGEFPTLKQKNIIFHRNKITYQDARIYFFIKNNFNDFDMEAYFVGMPSALQAIPEKLIIPRNSEANFRIRVSESNNSSLKINEDIELVMSAGSFENKIKCKFDINISKLLNNDQNSENASNSSCLLSIAWVLFWFLIAVISLLN